MTDKKEPSIFLFLLSPFFSLPLILQDIYQRRNRGFILLSCFVGILAYLYLPSEIQDGARRYLLYEEFITIDYDYFIEYYLYNRTDLVFYILIYLFAKIGIKFQILLFLLAFFNAYVPLFIFKKIMNGLQVSSKKYFSYFILIVLTYSLTFLFSGVRNNVAFSCVILGFYYLFFEKRKYLSYFLLILGVATHFSMIIYIPIFLLSKRLNIKILTFLFLLLTFLSFVIPSNLVQSVFLSVELGAETLDGKIQAYSSTKIGSEDTTLLTFIAKILFWFWFYFSLLYVFITLKRKRDNKFLIAYFLFALPVLLFLAFPGISHRYLFGLKFFFVLLLIMDSFYWNNVKWRKLFLVLLAIQPLYDIFRLMTQSFIAGYFRFENISLFTILMQTYTYKDMLPPY